MRNGLAARERVCLWVPGVAEPDLEGCLSVATGTTTAASVMEVSGFERGARTIAHPFRPLQAAELESVLADADCAPHRTVGLVRLQGAVIRELRGLFVRAKGTTRAAVNARQVAAGLSLRELERVSGWTRAGRASAIGYSSAWASAHATINGRTGKRVGLHMDSWDRLMPDQRWRGENRLCINLGESPRSFLFVPVTASTILRQLAARGVDVSGDPEATRDQYGSRDFARRYLQDFPDSTVFKLRVQPGEAYIAPTENIIHDGWLDSRTHDITLTVRGRFVPQHQPWTA